MDTRFCGMYTLLRTHYGRLCFGNIAFCLQHLPARLVNTGIAFFGS